MDHPRQTGQTMSEYAIILTVITPTIVAALALLSEASQAASRPSQHTSARHARRTRATAAKPPLAGFIVIDSGRLRKDHGSTGMEIVEAGYSSLKRRGQGREPWPPASSQRLHRRSSQRVRGFCRRREHRHDRKALQDDQRRVDRRDSARLPRIALHDRRSGESSLASSCSTRRSARALRTAHPFPAARAPGNRAGDQGR